MAITCTDVVAVVFAEMAIACRGLLAVVFAEIRPIDPRPSHRVKLKVARTAPVGLDDLSKRTAGRRGKETDTARARRNLAETNRRIGPKLQSGSFPF